MLFDLDDETRLLQRTVREFAEGEIAPVAEELDRTKTFPYELVAAMGELGWMGIPFPEEYGGAGGTSLQYAIAVEELTRVDSSIAITMCAHTSLGTQPIYRYGSEEQKQRYLPDLLAGRKLGAFGLTEPEAGSDAGNTKTRAEARRRRLGDQRRQAVHHQRRHRHHRPRGDHRAHRRGARDLQPDRRERHARLRAGRAVSQDGLERVRHAAAELRRLPGAGGEPARPARRRAQAVPGGPGHRPDRRRRDGRRPGPGRARPGARLRQGAPRLRPADQQLPDDSGQAGRPRHRDRGGPAADLQGRGAQGPEAATSASRRRRPS